MGSKFLIASAMVPLSFGVTTVAQSQRLAFEVVSVRPVQPIPIGGQRGPGSVPGLLGLPGVTDRPVLDRTGLTGEFTFEAKFAPVGNNGVNNTSSPSVFTALQEQLGLKLEAANASLEVLVIDRAEKPSEN